MILTGLFALAQALLSALILYYIGEILEDSKQLRSYLGLKVEGEEDSDFQWTAQWVEKIGRLVKIVAIISAVSSLVTTIMILFNA